MCQFQPFCKSPSRFIKWIHYVQYHLEYNSYNFFELSWVKQLYLNHKHIHFVRVLHLCGVHITLRGFSIGEIQTD